MREKKDLRTIVNIPFPPLNDRSDDEQNESEESNMCTLNVFPFAFGEAIQLVQFSTKCEKHNNEYESFFIPFSSVLENRPFLFEYQMKLKWAKPEANIR